MSRKSRMARSLAAMDTWTSLAHRESKLPRWYCPSCGMVRAEESWGSQQVIGDRVIAHYKNTDVKDKVLCPGGKIDVVRDRAP